MIISQNTTWHTGEIINLSETTQIAPGARLTIEPGAVVNGNNNSIQTFGELYIGGDRNALTLVNNTRLIFGATSANPGGYIHMDGVYMSGGGFLPTTGNGSYGHFDITNSLLIGEGSGSQNELIYVWYPTSDSSFTGNLIQGHKISVGESSKTINFSNNLLAGSQGVDVWATYGGQVNFVGNTFAQAPGAYAISLSIDGSIVRADSNYFGTVNPTSIAALLRDGSDDLNLKGIISNTNPLSQPSSTTPTLADLTNIGNDQLSRGFGTDTIFGGYGADTITDAGGQNYLRGGYGHDMMFGGNGFDDMHGNQGNDTLTGGQGDDWVVGGQGNDMLRGDSGGDVVYGNLGADTCIGDEGVDWVRGGQGDDSVHGGAGDDFLSGDKGSDTLSGGAGADRFNFFVGAGIDRITDFNSLEGDRIQFEAPATYTINQQGADTIIDLGGGDQVILVGVTQTALGTWLA